MYTHLDTIRYCKMLSDKELNLLLLHVNLIRVKQIEMCDEGTEEYDEKILLFSEPHSLPPERLEFIINKIQNYLLQDQFNITSEHYGVLKHDLLLQARAMDIWRLTFISVLNESKRQECVAMWDELTRRVDHLKFAHARYIEYLKDRELDRLLYPLSDRMRHFIDMAGYLNSEEITPAIA